MVPSQQKFTKKNENNSDFVQRNPSVKNQLFGTKDCSICTQDPRVRSTRKKTKAKQMTEIATQACVSRKQEGGGMCLRLYEVMVVKAANKRVYASVQHSRFDFKETKKENKGFERSNRIL